MDGPNVNWAFFSELRNYGTENDMSKLLSTGSCNLHAIMELSKLESRARIGNSKSFESITPNFARLAS